MQKAASSMAFVHTEDENCTQWCDSHTTGWHTEDSANRGAGTKCSWKACSACNACREPPQDLNSALNWTDMPYVPRIDSSMNSSNMPAMLEQRANVVRMHSDLGSDALLEVGSDALLEYVDYEDPDKPGCYVKLASGCGSREFRAPRWRRDVYGEEHKQATEIVSACMEVRAKDFSRWCEVEDVQMKFIAVSPRAVDQADEGHAVKKNEPGQPQHLPEALFTASSEAAVSEVAKPMNAAKSDALQQEVEEFEQEESVWSVAVAIGLNVRESHSKHSDLVGAKDYGDKVRGHLSKSGQWLKLVDGAGFVMVHEDSGAYLQRVEASAKASASKTADATAQGAAPVPVPDPTTGPAAAKAAAKAASAAQQKLETALHEAEAQGAESDAGYLVQRNAAKDVAAASASAIVIPFHQSEAAAEQLDRDCSDYKANPMAACEWTARWSCPDQGAGSHGVAFDDDSDGYACCCSSQLWTAATTNAGASSIDGLDKSMAKHGMVATLKKDFMAKPLALCLVQGNGNLPWMRLLLRAAGHPLWDYTQDSTVYDTALRDMDLVVTNISTFLGSPKFPYVKSVIVRDPVTRLLSGYLNDCRHEGRWTACMSAEDQPVTFEEMLTRMSKEGLGEADPIFRPQMDMCGLRDLEYEAVAQYEEASRTSKAVLMAAGMWEQYGTTGWGGLQDGQFSDIFGSDGAEEKVCDYLTPHLLYVVRQLYEDDFSELGYDPSYWTSQCGEQWLAAESTLAPADAHLLPHPGVESQYGLSSYYKDSSVCAPTHTELKTLSQPQHAPILSEFLDATKFYLHDDDAFNFSHTQHCFLNFYGLKDLDDNFDDLVYANVSEHLGELWLLSALKVHPQRTHNMKEAGIHIIGALPFLSYAAIQPELHGACGTHDQHEARMKDVGNAMLNLAAFQHSSGRNFFMFTTYYKVTDVFTPFVMSIVEKHNMILGTSDKEFTHWKPYPNIRRKVLLPYKAHYSAEYAETEMHDNKARSTNFLFRGQMYRTNEGSRRMAMMGLVSDQDGVDVKDIAFFEQAPAFTADLAKTYANSRFCLSPAGDTPTSRRLFDSLAAGCVPLALGNFDHLVDNLPFKRTIDWTKVVLFSGSLACNSKDSAHTAAWLSYIADASNKNMVNTFSAAGREVFEGALSYSRHGKKLVNALLKELVYEVSHANGRHYTGDLY